YVLSSSYGHTGDLFAYQQATGFARAIVDGEQISLTEPPTVEKQYKHTISVVVARLVAKPGMRPRLTDSVETALGLAEGRIDIDLVDEGRTRTFSEHMSCPNEHPLTI